MLDAKGELTVTLPNGVDNKHPVELNLQDTLHIDVPGADPVEFKCSTKKVIPAEAIAVTDPFLPTAIDLQNMPSISRWDRPWTLQSTSRSPPPVPKQRTSPP